MPDDNFRPTHGLPPEPRPTNTPPAWWSQLERVDLPDSSAETSSSGGNRWRPDTARGRRTRPGAKRGWQAVAINLAVFLAAVVLIGLGMSIAGSGATGATLIICGMVALLAAIGVAVARRIGRRW
jgi:hypothetical protein